MQSNRERPYRRKVYQVADIQVSKNKFEREVDIFRASINSYHSRGIFIIHANFPHVYVAFKAQHINPTQVAFVTKIDFVNYDVEAPSVVFVAPYNLQPVSYETLKTTFPKLFAVNGQWYTKENLLVAYTPDDIPFVCIEGVREYHLHPAHLGNSWFIHRKRGTGTLGYLIDQIYQNGILTLRELPSYSKLAGYKFFKI